MIEIVKTVKTVRSGESKTKYFNINVSKEDVEYKPDIVRLFADKDHCLEYVLKSEREENKND